MSGCHHPTPTPNQNPLRQTALPSESHGLLSPLATRLCRLFGMPRFRRTAQIRSDQIRSRTSCTPISSNRTHTRCRHASRPARNAVYSAPRAACKRLCFVDAGFRIELEAHSTAFGGPSIRSIVFVFPPAYGCRQLFICSCCRALAWGGRSGVPCYMTDTVAPPNFFYSSSIWARRPDAQGWSTLWRPSSQRISCIMPSIGSEGCTRNRS